MKTESIQISVPKYVCEGCGKESRYEKDISSCETAHKQEVCLHKVTYWEIQMPTNNLYGGIYGVIEFCKKCKKHQRRIFTYDLDEKLIKDGSFQIELFELLKKYAKILPL